MKPGVKIGLVIGGVGVTYLLFSNKQPDLTLAGKSSTSGSGGLPPGYARLHNIIPGGWRSLIPWTSKVRTDPGLNYAMSLGTNWRTSRPGQQVIKFGDWFNYKG